MYKLFIADDETIIIQGLKKILDWSSLNIEISGEASNGKIAEENILALNPDLVILDIRMPLRSGLDILHSIKNKAMDTQVIFLSAYEEFIYVQDALESGAQNYLTKPVDKKKLLKAVKTALKQIDLNNAAKAAMEKILQIEKEQTAINPGSVDFSIDEFIKSIKNEQIRYILAFMNEHYAENITLERIAKMAYMNPYYFSVYFNKNTGLHFKECLTRIRLVHAIKLLEMKDIKTYEVAEMVGFTDPRYFSELFKKIYHKTPSEYKRNKI
ncbi:MAG: response regulator [Treponema sp.]|jgi:two-component system response regulator YesN|nr:response regulator [Treponema sp.]